MQVLSIKINRPNHKQTKDIKFVKDKSGCFICVSHVAGSNGYPCAVFDNGYEKISRALYRSVNGPIKKGLVIMHSCDNPKCINIKHLSSGTQKQNNDDKMNKKRHPYGERHHKSKLNTKKILKIRFLLKHLSCKAISRAFKVSPTTIVNIKNNKIWKEVKDDRK